MTDERFLPGITQIFGLIALVCCMALLTEHFFPALSAAELSQKSETEAPAQFVREWAIALLSLGQLTLLALIARRWLPPCRILTIGRIDWKASLWIVGLVVIANVGGMLFAMLLGTGGTTGLACGKLSYLPAQAPSIAISVLTLVPLAVIAPLYQEYAFRQFLGGLMVGRFGVIVAALVSSLLFSAQHFADWGNPGAMVNYVLVGLVLFTAWRHFGGWLVPLIMHLVLSGIFVASLTAICSKSPY